MWLAIGTGMLTLLIAAMGKQRKSHCRDYSINITGIQGDEFFLDEADILKLLKAATKGKIKGQPKSDFDLRKMEQLLEDNVWVKDAQLYFDNRDVLHVSVKEREPVARVFTTAGKSYYLDNDGKFMQLSDKLSARLPVFTGFPDKKLLSAPDSLLLRDVLNTATFINGHPFWTSQVAQVDIDQTAGASSRQMIMIPVVGNQSIRLGDGKDIEKKFNRLFVFYKEVLSKTGFEKYKSIDVSFAGQVVAAKSENPRVDSVQLRKNVEVLLRQIKEMEKLNEAESKLPTPVPMQPVMPDSTVKATVAVTDAKPVKNDPKPVDNKPLDPKPTDSKPVKQSVKTNPKPADSKRAPKAIMPKRN